MHVTSKLRDDAIMRSFRHTVTILCQGHHDIVLKGRGKVKIYSDVPQVDGQSRQTLSINYSGAWVVGKCQLLFKSLNSYHQSVLSFFFSR